MRLTRRGNTVLGIFTMLALLAAIGLAGWIEGLPV